METRSCFSPLTNHSKKKQNKKTTNWFFSSFLFPSFYTLFTNFNKKNNPKKKKNYKKKKGFTKEK